MDSQNIIFPIDTSGLDVDEYNRFRKNIIYRYKRYRFVGMSASVQRTGDKTLVSTATANSINTLSIVNQRPCRMRCVLDSYQDQNFAEVIANDMGVDNAPNVKHIGTKGVKVCKFTVPQNIKNVQWRQVTNQEIPVPQSATIPPAYAAANIPTLMEYFYPTTYNQPTSGNVQDNVPNNALLYCDVFPRTPVPPALTGNTVTPITTINLTLFKNFYYECSGIDANGGDNL